MVNQTGNQHLGNPIENRRVSLPKSTLTGSRGVSSGEVAMTHRFAALLLATLLLAMLATIAKASPMLPQQTGAAHWLLPAAQAENFDLSLTQSVIITRLNIINQVEFNVVVTNNGPNEANRILFNLHPPVQFDRASLEATFSLTATKTGDTRWLINGPVAAQQSLKIKITGLATLGACNQSSSSLAEVRLTDNRTDLNQGNNAARSTFVLPGTATCVYIPMIQREPPPTPTLTPTPTPTHTSTPNKPRLLYFENFNDDDDNWSRGGPGDCSLKVRNNEYRIFIDAKDDGNDDDDDDNEACFGAAPNRAERRHGIFQVEAFRRDGGNNFSYGLFINGDIDDDNNLDEYYLFRVYPNIDRTCPGDWELYRFDNPEAKILADRKCEPKLNGGAARNTLAIEHGTNNRLYIYINNQFVAGPITDNNPLRHGSLGVYAQQNNDDLDIRFDNFAIFEPFTDNVARQRRFGVRRALDAPLIFEPHPNRHARLPPPSTYKFQAED